MPFKHLIFLCFFSIFALWSCREKSQKNRIEKAVSHATFPTHFHLPILPDSVKIFGEKVDLTDADIRERLDRELHSLVYRHSHIFLYFRRANRYFPWIERVLEEKGIPTDFKYLALVESGLEQGTSISGAQGFWQFMPKTAKMYGLQITNEIDERRHFTLSTRAAASYLREAYDTLGSWSLAAASYNRGVGGIRSDLRNQSVASFYDAELNNETARYVIRIVAMKLIFEQPLAYGFVPEKMELYEPIETIEVSVEAIKNMNVWAVEQGWNKKVVLLLNPWILGNQLSKRSTPYQISLPRDKSQLKIHH